jgi:hypothetical protein
MNKEILKSLDKYRTLIIVAVCVVLIGGFALVASLQPPKKTALEIAQTNLEISTINAVKANLNVYYVDKREYPFDYDELIDYTDSGKDILIKAKDELKDFKYTHRGDYQAYKITYTNADGKKIVVEGNYQEDYQE